MAQDKPIPLVGRLAIQLKMLTPAEVSRAMAESESSGNPRLAQVMLSMGLLDRDQIAKLQQVQKDLVEKQRARMGGGDAPERPAASTAAARPPAAARPANEIHRVAEHAAKAAAPMQARDIDDLYGPPSAAEKARPLPSAAPSPSAPKSPSAPRPAAATPAAPSPAPAAAAPAAPSAPPAAPSSPVQAPTRSPSPPPPAASQSPPQPSIAPVVTDGRPSLELVVPEPGAADRDRLEALLAAGVAAKASDIHLHAGGPIKQRRIGELVVVDESVDPAAVERMVAAALTPEQRARLAHAGELDFCFDLPGVGRFRANAYRQQRGLDAVFRSIPDRPPTLAELGLPEELKKYTDYHQGMVLITGPAGCGKSATLAALVNHINESRDDHILTVEDPIEIVHPSKRCLVNQRHAGAHTKSFSRALRAALREDPDIIVIGELRDLETISLAMTAAETGHFVLATLHTANAVRTVNRMIGAFPSNEQDQVRAMLSESLRAVISQRLVPTADGEGRVPALEMLVINRAIGNLVRDQKTIQIRSSMQTGKAHGMYLLEQSLNELVASGRVTREVALSLAEEEKLITAGA
ncbi:MAG: type IV pilus twitching motility protein PilT [Myxococcota bacterium]